MEEEKEKLIQVQYKGKKALVMEGKNTFFVVQDEFSPLVNEVIKRLTGKSLKEGKRVNRYLTKIKKGG